MSDNVVPIAVKQGQKPPIAVQRTPYGGCTHKATIIDEEQRAVDCADCGARLDPIAVLMGLARDWSRWERELERLTELRAGYGRDLREKWERRRDRHINANPTHAGDEFKGSWTSGDCRTCYSLHFSSPSSVRRDHIRER